jgi:hypothetical protein
MISLVVQGKAFPNFKGHDKSAQNAGHIDVSEMRADIGKDCRGYESLVERGRFLEWSLPCRVYFPVL